MSATLSSSVHPVLHLVLERVLRTECLVLESLRLQTQGGYNGLPGGGSEQRLRAAEQRAYQRAEILLHQLLTATCSPAADDLR
jgi:hypothetical protein